MLIENIVNGFATALSPYFLILIIASVFLGMMSGAIPGMSGTMTVVILLPVTFVMEPTAAFVVLSAIYAGSVYAGSISGIMFRIPGAPEAIMTTIDGYAMNQKGQLDEAISTAVFASAIGGIVGSILLIFFAPALAGWAITFSDAEYFAVVVLGLALVSTVASQNLVKGIISCCIGLLIAVVGLDPATGVPRFTFDTQVLMGGFDFIPVLLGIFAIAEVLKVARQKSDLIGDQQLKAKFSGAIVPPLSFFRRYGKIISTNSVMGTLIGTLPGAGATTGALFGYTVGQRLSPKDIREQFGKGVGEAIASPESANNSAASGAFVPLLALGIPGSGTTAVILGAFILHGIRPGPTLFAEQPNIAYTIFAALLLANIFILLMNIPFVRLFTKVRHIPSGLLMGLILAFCIIGAFTTRSSTFDIWVMFAAGIGGYFLDKYNYSVAPLVLGLVLGPIAEPSLRRTLVLGGGPEVFINRPLAGTFLLLSVLVFFVPIVLEKTNLWQRLMSTS